MVPYFILPYYYEEKREEYLSYKLQYPHLSWEDVITNVDIGLNRDFYTDINIIRNPNSYRVLVNKYQQLPNSYLPEDLELIDTRYNPSMLLLRHDARLAFEIMCLAAARDGLKLEAVSTYRSFDYQEEVYYRKHSEEVSLDEYRRERDKVSARAGHSEHQTGLAVDINDLEQTFEDTQEGQWLSRNCYLYGFILRYPKGKEYITGYDYEPWHFRYLGIELSKNVILSGLTFDEYYIRYIEPFV